MRNLRYLLYGRTNYTLEDSVRSRGISRPKGTSYSLVGDREGQISMATQQPIKIEQVPYKLAAYVARGIVDARPAQCKGRFFEDTYESVVTINGESCSQKIIYDLGGDMDYLLFPEDRDLKGVWKLLSYVPGMGSIMKLFNTGMEIEKIEEERREYEEKHGSKVRRIEREEDGEEKGEKTQRSTVTNQL